MMMALGHTISGLAVGVVTVSAAGPEPRAQVAWVAVVAGCALLPDLDATGTTVSRLWGPLTGGFRPRILGRRRTLIPGLTQVVGTIAGGHRRGSHSILGMVTVLIGVWAAHFSHVAAGLVLALCIGLALAAAGLIVPGKQPYEYWPLNLGLSAAGAWWLTQAGVGLPWWLAFAMAFGAATHILGDMITRQGCPLSWPTKTHRISLLPLRAGGPTERLLIVPALVVLIVVLLSYRAGYDPAGAILTAWREVS